MKTICIITALTALLACVAHGQRNDQPSKANITQLRTDAEKGDTTAQYLLGMRYAKGEGVTLDRIEAYKWLHAAVERGNGQAVYPRYELSALLTQDEIRDAQERATKILVSMPASKQSNADASKDKRDSPPPSSIKSTEEVLRDLRYAMRMAELISSKTRAATNEKGRIVLDRPSNDWPTFIEEVAGPIEVRVVNPNDFTVRVGLRSGGKGKDFVVANGETESVRVANGRYHTFFQYSSDPDGLYQGDSFTLSNTGIEIEIAKVVDGNYGIRKVK